MIKFDNGIPRKSNSNSQIIFSKIIASSKYGMSGLQRSNVAVGDETTTETMTIPRTRSTAGNNFNSSATIPGIENRHNHHQTQATHSRCDSSGKSHYHRTNWQYHFHHFAYYISNVNWCVRITLQAHGYCYYLVDCRARYTWMPYSQQLTNLLLENAVFDIWISSMKYNIVKIFENALLLTQNTI